MFSETSIVGSLHIITGMYDKLELRLKTRILTTLHNSYAVAPIVSYALIIL